MKWYDFLSFLFCVLEMCCCVWLFHSFAEKRKANSKSITVVYVIVLSGVAWVLSSVFYENLHARAIAYMGILSVAMYRLFRIRYIKSVVLSVLFYGTLLITEYFSLIVVNAAFPGKLWGVYNWYLFFYMAYIMSKVLQFGVFWCIRRMVGGRTQDILTVREWYAIAAISFITVFSIIPIVSEPNWAGFIKQPVDFLHIYVAIEVLLINCISYYLIHSIVEREMKLREHAVFREKVKNETAMYHSVSENLERQRKRTHEYKNQLAVISALAAEGADQELRAYIEKIQASLQQRMDAVDTNNVIVNAILNTKYREAVERDIVFVLKVNDLSGMKIEEEDIVVILSNLLNNALEACERCEEKVMKLKLVLEDGQIVISVKNSMETAPVVENGEFLTSKAKDADEHGMGIRNVAETVEKYGGRYMVDFGDGSFQFSILMPNG